MDGAPVDAWLYFPGIKVGKIHPYFFFLTVFGGVDYNRCEVWSTIIPRPYSWLKLFFFALLVFLSHGSLNSSQCEEPVQIRPVFVPRNFVYG